MGEQATIGWCEACTQNRSWGQVPMEETSGMSPDTMPIRSHYADTANLPGRPVPRKGFFQTCPLCGCGVAGAEHISVFCRAIAEAWSIVGPPGCDWWLGTITDGNLGIRLAFNHGVAWLNDALAQAVRLHRTPWMTTEKDAT